MGEFKTRAAKGAKVIGIVTTIYVVAVWLVGIDAETMRINCMVVGIPALLLAVYPEILFAKFGSEAQDDERPPLVTKEITILELDGETVTVVPGDGLLRRRFRLNGRDISYSGPEEDQDLKVVVERVAEGKPLQVFKDGSKLVATFGTSVDGYGASTCRTEYRLEVRPKTNSFQITSKSETSD